LQISQATGRPEIEVTAACDGLAQCLVEQGRSEQAKPIIALAVRLRRAAGTDHDGPLGSVALITLANGTLVTVDKPV
jgi:hypothetical protein